MTVLLRTVARALFVPGIALALAILVKGYKDTGDGFSAGAIAGLAVALQYLAYGREEVEQRLAVRLLPWAAPLGLAIGLGVAAASMIRGAPLLTHSPEPGSTPVHLGTLDLTTAFLFDVGLYCVVLGFVAVTIHLLASEEDEA